MSRTHLTFVGFALGWAVVAAGCGPSSDYQPAKSLPSAPPADHHEHEHGEGPHHGQLVELGEDEFHAELVLDDKAHTLRMYLLGSDAKSEATTAATEILITKEDTTTVTLKPAAGSEAGKHTVFELVDEKVVHELAEAGFLHGTLVLTIGEKPYSAELDVHFDGSEHMHADEVKPAEPAAVEKSETPQ